MSLITKATIVADLNKRFDIPRKDASKFITCYARLLSEYLEAGDSVLINRVVKISTIRVKARSRRNVLTGEPIAVPAHVRPRYKTMTHLRNNLKGTSNV